MAKSFFSLLISQFFAGGNYYLLKLQNINTSTQIRDVKRIVYMLFNFYIK